MKMYLIGGAVRDEIMNVKSKDLDYSVVLEDKDIHFMSINDLSPFETMVHELGHMGYKIFLETPEHLTVRAQTPDRKETADFVLARKEGTYTDGRRPDSVEPGTLMDDLKRRDFTMNAIAKDADGSYIDPFNGREDINERIIRAVGDPFERLTEDALRAVRALRFSVTKDFEIEPSLSFAMRSAAVTRAIRDNIADERISDELSKMFRFDTVASIRILNEYPALTRAMFLGSVSLDSTMKTKGRGK